MFSLLMPIVERQSSRGSKLLEIRTIKKVREPPRTSL